MTNKQKLDALIPMIRGLFSEISNPSPCGVMKEDYCRRIAELIGEPNPYDQLRAWHGKPRGWGE